LLRTPGVGSKTFLKILETHTPAQLFALGSSDLNHLGLNHDIVRALKQPDWHNIEADLRWLDSPGNHIIKLNDDCYPAQLKEISDPPPVLFVRGKPEILSHPQIAIVGSRNPSSLGLETAFAFAKTLSLQGFVITSGMALGIDAASHQGALAANGFTIAVAGTGLDRVYPARHLELATQIVDSGALISEFPPGTLAKAANFPRRNRIISGLCQGLLVVEAAKESGSLITARFALEHNREVFAIPGSIHNPLSRGCNALIREGAKLVETTQDILEEFCQYNQLIENNFTNNLQSTLDLEQQTILNRVMFSPTSVDKLVEETGMSVEKISSTCLILELHGFVEFKAGHYIRLK
jgi:DNA processing protein